MQKSIEFSKYSGAGNDFILIDRRYSSFENMGLPENLSDSDLIGFGIQFGVPRAKKVAKSLPLSDWKPKWRSKTIKDEILKFSGGPNMSKLSIQSLCDRHQGIGADGLIFLENSKIADYRMRIFNADGEEADMCGNGLRTLAAFIKDLGLKDKSVTIETPKDPLLKIHRCHYFQKVISTEMGIPQKIMTKKKINIDNKSYTYDFLNTGAPHTVLFVKHIDKVDVSDLGTKIRQHEYFAPVGTNVNFVSALKKDTLAVRTFEKGVEGETLACGTGATAAALSYALTHQIPSPIHVQTVSGQMLRINFFQKNKAFKHVELLGPTKLLFKGEFSIGNYLSID